MASLYIIFYVLYGRSKRHINTFGILNGQEYTLRFFNGFSNHWNIHKNYPM